jgi:uncharacterized protein YkwD
MKKKFTGIIAIVLVLSVAVPMSAGAANTTGFSDVRPSDWYYNAVLSTASDGLFNGTSATTFSPSASMTRGMFVTSLGRMAGVPDSYGRTKGTPFADVTQADYYFPYVVWAENNGIVTGVGEKRFNPNGEITREQIAAILYRYAQKHSYNQTYTTQKYAAFNDTADVSDYAVKAMQWVTTCGIINGANGKLSPQAKASRAQVAQILFNFKQLKTIEPTIPAEPIKPDDTGGGTVDFGNVANAAVNWETYNPHYTIPTGKSEVDADGGYFDYDLAIEVMDQINTLRIENCAPALLYNPKIEEWASIRALEISIFCSHTRPDGTPCLTVGIGLCFENLIEADNYTAGWKADIQGYAEELVTAWYNSESHKRSMLSPAAKLGAISCYVKGNNLYIAHLFSMKTLYYMDYLI